MIMRIFFSLMLFTLIFTNAYSQHHVCGTTIHDQELMEENFRAAHQDLLSLRGDKIYIPVKFHLVGKDDGKGKVTYKSLLNQLNILNRDYAAHNFVFYLKDGYNFGSIDNTKLYDTPRENENQFKPKKDPKAVNIFVVNTIGDASLGQIVAGYYSPSNDLVVVLKSELDKLSNTLSHEVGHFFNLRHTFYGWEEVPYLEEDHGNPCVISFAPGTNINIEKMNKSNCGNSGDNVCDTPPDYHFDINYSNNNCFFTKIVRDINGDTIKTMVNNQMSYFSKCDTFKFTVGQEDRMRSNFGNNLRAHLRSTYVPNTDTLPSLTNFIWPQDRDTAYNYTSVDFSWEDQSSDYYLLEIQNGSEYYYYFTTATSITVNDLKAKKQYFTTIRSFNDGYTGTTTASTRFFTGDLQTSTNDVDHNTNLVVFPNPVSGDKIFFRLKSNETVNTVNIVDIKGMAQKVNFNNEGNGLYSVHSENLNQKSSLNLLVINTTNASYTQKIILE